MPQEFSQCPRYFLGANSANGFFSLFSEAYQPESGWRAVLLKGGPGSGKSTLMRRCVKSFLEHGLTPELCYCSADPQSLDAVILPGKRLMIADATAPHILEPKFPGGCETVFDSGTCWNADQLYAKRDTVFRLQRRIAGQHRRARRFLTAAGNLLAENRQLASDCLYTEPLRGYAKRLANRLFPRKILRNSGECKRFLSGITPEGLICFDSTLSLLADRIILIDDETGAAATALLAELRLRAMQAGYRIITVPCALFPEDKTDALLIPELSLAFTVSNSFHRPDFLPDRVIHIRRFLDLHRYSAYQPKLRLDRRMARELLGEASDALREARTIHSELENVYCAAMDFAQLDEQTDRLIRSLLQKVT